MTEALWFVDPTAGVTRDRVTHLIVVRDHYFELVDTGGMGIEDSDNLTAEVEEQIEAAIASAAVILFVLDTQTGITPLDEQVVKRLRYVDVPVICVANKTDTQAMDPQADEFYKLGRGKLVKVSTAHNRGRDELMHVILDRLPKEALPSKALAITNADVSVIDIAARFRAANPPIIGRVHDDRFLLDLRCIDRPEDVVPCDGVEPERETEPPRR